MSDKEVLIIDGVIKGILAFLSNPKNEIYYLECIEQIKDGNNKFPQYFLWDAMEAITWFSQSPYGYVMVYDFSLWRKCVDHALMILEKEYQYES